MTRQEYTDRVLANLRRVTPEERAAIREELDAHMEDHICDLLDLGYDEALAEERTMQRMDDPEEVGRELDKPTADALLHNAVNAGALEVPFARLIAAAVSERALHAVPVEIRKTARSSIFKQMLLTTASDGFFERRSLQ